MKLVLAFFILFTSCHTAKKITHPLMREDGFYYRKKHNDVYQLIRFYSNGRVTINQILAKPDRFTIYQDKIMCCTDSTNKKFPDLTTSSFILLKDSVFFKKIESKSFFNFNTLFFCKLHADSITAEIRAVDVDTSTTIKNNNPFVTFKFVKAKCDSNLKIPKTTDWGEPVKELKDN